MAPRPDIQGEGALRSPLDYFSRKDQFENKVYKDLKREVLQLSTEKQLKNLHGLVFAMIKPAAFTRGLAPEIVQWLHQVGFKIVLYKFGEVKGEELDKLYLFVKRKYQESWWIMERAYSMAPALAMVLVGNKNNHEHACARLRDLIGPTTPEAGTKGNLRYDLKGVNRVFNIIHVSDDPAAALRESSVFFELKEVIESITSEDEVNLSINKLKPNNSRRISRWEIFSKLKRRCNLLLNSEKLQKLLDTELEILAEDFPFDKERKELLPIEREISKIARSIWEETNKEAINKARTKLPLRDKRIWEEINDKLCSARCIELLSDELELTDESNFELYLLWMINRNVITDGWEEIITHSTWAVMPQMIKDFKKYEKIIISRRS